LTGSRALRLIMTVRSDNGRESQIISLYMSCTALKLFLACIPPASVLLIETKTKVEYESRDIEWLMHIEQRDVCGCGYYNGRSGQNIRFNRNINSLVD
jgi:hypothetical protein